MTLASSLLREQSDHRMVLGATTFREFVEMMPADPEGTATDEIDEWPTLMRDARDGHPPASWTSSG
ncbi:hypothetical protein CYJ73_15840 [Gordonia terrae]|uniref:Uncharacterized protein n=2 Tax=Gordonia terrae TaxID=2055 RepID=A0A2I1R675_9ACTN|nr:hypothetical protein [Gordonia terrae]PKZ64627.1 hypothetical protein CYJ73_15840 [Gordonia terrae]